MQTKQGQFIVIDGPDGAGKTTVLNELKARLEADGVPVVFTREPGGTPYAEKIRETILSEEAKNAHPLTMLYLFNAARVERMFSAILPLLEKGTHVISDRFDSTTYAYQIVAEECDITEMFNVLREVYARIRPYYILLDVPPEIGRSRSEERGASNHFDRRSLEWHARARKGFKEFLTLYAPSASSVVNAERKPEEVLQNVYDIVRRLVR